METLRSSLTEVEAERTALNSECAKLKNQVQELLQVKQVQTRALARLTGKIVISWGRSRERGFGQTPLFASSRLHCLKCTLRNPEDGPHFNIFSRRSPP